jgi:hypothetical protein
MEEGGLTVAKEHMKITEIIENIAKTIWLAEFERAFSRTPSDPWENQAEKTKAQHHNTARKLIDSGVVGDLEERPAAALRAMVIEECATMSKQQEDLIYRAYLCVCSLKRCEAKWGTDLQVARSAELLKAMGETFPFIPERVANSTLRGSAQPQCDCDIVCQDRDDCRYRFEIPN